MNIYHITISSIINLYLSDKSTQPQWNGVLFPESEAIKGVDSIENIKTPKAFPKTSFDLPRPH
jgi:hypothetical protein